MTLISREKLTSLVKQIKQGNISQVYLVFGDRYLCQQAADILCQALMSDGGTVHAVDGEQEDLAVTLLNLRSFSLLPGRQIYRVSDTRLFHSKNVAGGLWKKMCAARENNKEDLAARHLQSMLVAAGLDPADPELCLAGLAATRWKQYFGFPKPGDPLDWLEPLREKAGSLPTPSSSADPVDIFKKIHHEGLPENNILLLLSEEVDRRKKLFKLFKDKFTVIDCSVESGSSSRAQKVQKSVLRELVKKTMDEFGKTMPAPVTDRLIERVGFHPVAVVMESEKLALYVGNRQRITPEDLDAVVGRTRQEALFELTDAVGKKNLDRALLVAGRIQENGIHPLAIIATLRNYARTLLLFRSLLMQERYDYRPTMNADQFKGQCLPLLKENGSWATELSGHPYALFMQFRTAASFSLTTLCRWPRLILEGELRLKGSPVSARTVIAHLLASMLSREA
ncbi:DNA polymerase III subunit delta [Desulfolithobacter sp.]